MSSHVKNFSYNLNVARQNKCCGTVLCNLISHLAKCKEGKLPLFNFFNLTCMHVCQIKYLVCMALSAFNVVKETCAFQLGFRCFKD